MQDDRCGQENGKLRKTDAHGELAYAAEEPPLQELPNSMLACRRPRLVIEPAALGSEPSSEQ